MKAKIVIDPEHILLQRRCNHFISRINSAEPKSILKLLASFGWFRVYRSQPDLVRLKRFPQEYKFILTLACKNIHTPKNERETMLKLQGWNMFYLCITENPGENWYFHCFIAAQ